jgi:CheY-like chemotaxis protein
METDSPNKPSVLLVEDTLTQALLMQHQLKKAGYTVKLARSGKAALEESAKEQFGIILSDINMPGMDGYQLCKELKAKNEYKSVPFILLATPVEKPEILRMLESGADNFILKAFDESTFLSKLDDIVKTAALRRNGDKSQSVYAGEEIVMKLSPEVADFMLSAFEMYLFQLHKASPPQAEKAETH